MTSVLISGASIAGPTLAYWLNRAGFRTTVVERAPAPRPGGQAIDIRGRAIAVVEQMGLLDRVYAQRTRFKGMTILDKDGNEASRTEERTMTGGRFTSGDIELLRDDLANLLIDATRADSEYIFDDTVVALEQTASRVEVTLQRGGRRTFDLAIGADGVNSPVRQLTFGNDAQVIKPLGVAYAIYTIPNILDLKDWQIGFRGSRFGFVVYPARDNSELRVNFLFSIESGDDLRGNLAAQKALVIARCGHMGGIVPKLLEALHAVPELYFGPLALLQMPTWSKGRVTLVGDAGYCPSPYSGQGTSLALIGAFVLASELKRTPQDHAGAFARCEHHIQPFVKLNQDMVSVSRAGPIPDEMMDHAKNGIDLSDVMALWRA